MRKAIFLPLCFALLPPAAPASAQEACAPRGYVVQELAEKFGERQVAIGLATGGQVMEIFASPTQEWTLVATYPDGTSCVVAAGTHLTLAPAQPVSPPRDPA
jgi:hypothetical protein